MLEVLVQEYVLLLERTSASDGRRDSLLLSLVFLNIVISVSFLSFFIFFVCV